LRRITPPIVPAARVKSLRRQLTRQDIASQLWKRTTGQIGAFKSTLTDQLKVNQDRRCAYCGTYLFEDFPHRDHIAPKNPHFNWTFWPTNLVLACYSCNTDRKKRTDTVSQVHPTYRRSKFRIIHPYFDDPNAHLNFIGHRGKILINPKNGSAKGKETIELFDLMSPERAKQRAKDALLDRDVAHLHGRWRYLFEQLAFSPLTESRALKMKK